MSSGEDPEDDRKPADKEKTEKDGVARTKANVMDKKKIENGKQPFPMVEPPVFGKTAPHISLKGRFSTAFLPEGELMF